MPSFPKPTFVFPFDVPTELQHLRAHKVVRKIPERQSDRLLIGSWNIANLGLQDRTSDHYELIAEIISWFDIVAIQEVNDNLEGLRAIESFLPSKYDFVFTDKGGNNERSCFAYDGSIKNQLELVGEIAVPPKDNKWIKIEGFTEKFTGFDRNPFLSSFQWRDSIILLITVHSFFGGTSKQDLERRALEAYAIGRYADLGRKSVNAFSKNIIALGDFNIPMIERGDVVYDALIKRGLQLPEHSTKVYSNITNDKMYDQIAFLPDIKNKIELQGVFDFDTKIFPELWQNDTPLNFRAYLRYYISDHRPLWLQLRF